jgi:crotonobetainyl-CoA:carnitine CoA-transferase CaiB-like acyl-CoA transferase
MSMSHQLPLANLRVLDASRVLAGPYCAAMLGDLGARVIKVERPRMGDQTRAWGPPYLQTESAYYLSANRNKRSITLNLKVKSGQEIFRRLAAQCDVLVESFQVGDLDKLNLGYETLKRLDSKLVYCSITGYGQTGPWKERPAYDLSLQAESGWMSLTGESLGRPVRVGVAIVDLFTAHYAMQAILAALLARGRTGLGRRIDVAMLDCAVASLCYMAQYYLATGQQPEKMGAKHPTIVPYQAFETQDGYVIAGVASPEIWARFCEAIGRKGLATDERFAQNAERVKHRHALDSILAPRFKEHSTEEWVRVFQKNEVPAAPVNQLKHVFALSQVQVREMLQTIAHPTIGKLPLLGIPIRFDETSIPIRTPPPLLGQHTEEILQELEYSPKQIAEFRMQGVL